MSEGLQKYDSQLTGIANTLMKIYIKARSDKSLKPFERDFILAMLGDNIVSVCFTMNFVRNYKDYEVHDYHRPVGASGSVSQS